LTSIGDAAFAYRIESNINDISSLNLNNVIDVGPSAFMRNTFIEVDFGDAISNIGDYAFAYSKYKYDIDIPDTLCSIGENAFYKNVILNPTAV
jgi:hypothetical protein